MVRRKPTLMRLTDEGGFGSMGGPYYSLRPGTLRQTDEEWEKWTDQVEDVCFRAWHRLKQELAALHIDMDVSAILLYQDAIWDGDEVSENAHDGSKEELADLKGALKKLAQQHDDDPADSAPSADTGISLVTRLQAYLSRTGITKTELAERLRVTPLTVHNWFGNRTVPQACNLSKIALLVG